MTGTPALKRMLDTGAQFSEMSQQAGREVRRQSLVKAVRCAARTLRRLVQRLVDGAVTTTEHVAELDAGRGRQAARPSSPTASTTSRLASKALPATGPRVEAVCQGARSLPATRSVEASPRSRPEEGPGQEDRRQEAAAKKTAGEEDRRRRRPPPRRPRRRRPPAKKTAAKKPPPRRLTWPSAARLDAEMVRRGLVPSRAEAAVPIDANRVLVNGAVADKSARLVDPGDAVVVAGSTRRDSSVAAATSSTPRSTRSRSTSSGSRVLDAGASTGGFTDCLLQRGAARRGGARRRPRPAPPAHPRRRARARVIERFHVRDRDARRDRWSRSTLVVADLSFISLDPRHRRSLMACASPGADLVLLVKPQFEAGQAEVDRGQRRDHRSRRPRRACEARSTSADGTAVATVVGWIESPITRCRRATASSLCMPRLDRSGSAP